MGLSALLIKFDRDEAVSSTFCKHDVVSILLSYVLQEYFIFLVVGGGIPAPRPSIPVISSAVWTVSSIILKQPPAALPACVWIFLKQYSDLFHNFCIHPLSLIFVTPFQICSQPYFFLLDLFKKSLLYLILHFFQVARRKLRFTYQQISVNIPQCCFLPPVSLRGWACSPWH